MHHPTGHSLAAHRPMVVSRRQAALLHPLVGRPSPARCRREAPAFAGQWASQRRAGRTRFARKGGVPRVASETPELDDDHSSVLRGARRSLSPGESSSLSSGGLRCCASSQAIMSSAPAGRPLLPECATVTTHLETNPTQPPWIAVRPRLMSVASDRGAPLDRAKDRRALSARRSARPAWLAACDLVGDLSRAAMRSGSMRSGCAVAPASRRRPGTVGRHRADPFGCG
jgi:hypothetical protein